jgi:hypothetical protein
MMPLFLLRHGVFNDAGEPFVIATIAQSRVQIVLAQ